MAKAKAKSTTAKAEAKATTHGKRKWHHVHKVQVHPNRWLIWALCLAILTCAALIAHIRISEIHFETQMRQDMEIIQTWSVFRNDEQGYQLKYPRTWGVESEGESMISFVNAQNPNEYFSVSSYPLSQERAVRDALFSTSETDITVDGLDGVLLSQSRNQPENVALVKDSQRLYALRGKGPNFQRILSTFMFDEKLERI